MSFVLSLLISLYVLAYRLSSSESSPVSVQDPKQVDCDISRFSNLLLASLFLLKDESDQPSDKMGLAAILFFAWCF